MLASGNAIGVLANLSYEACGKGGGHQLAPARLVAAAEGAWKIDCVGGEDGV